MPNRKRFTLYRSNGALRVHSMLDSPSHALRASSRLSSLFSKIGEGFP